MKGKEVVPWCDGTHKLEAQGEVLCQTKDGHEKGDLLPGIEQYR